MSYDTCVHYIFGGQPPRGVTSDGPMSRDLICPINRSIARAPEAACGQASLFTRPEWPRSNVSRDVLGVLRNVSHHALDP